MQIARIIICRMRLFSVQVEFVVIIKFYIKTFKFESSKFSQINSQMYLYSF